MVCWCKICKQPFSFTKKALTINGDDFCPECIASILPILLKLVRDFVKQKRLEAV